MFSKLKKLTKFKILTKANISDKITAIQVDLGDGLFQVMEKAYGVRQQDSLNSNFTLADTQQIIDGYANKNMMIAAATSIVPGPFGILGAVPELLLNFNNQMSMIYDLGCASGKENFINKDVLLDIPIAAFGGNTNLAALQNSGKELLDSPQSLLADKAGTLAKSITERVLKKSVVQFIPVAGPILMGVWSKMATRKISTISINFLDNQKSYIEKITPADSPAIKKQIQIEKIKGLANLIESNNEINENQIEFIGTIIENSSLDQTEKAYYLEESLKTGSKFKIDKALLAQYEEEEDLLVEMVVMAKRSGSVDKYEEEYIYQLGQELGIEEDFIRELL